MEKVKREKVEMVQFNLRLRKEEKEKLTRLSVADGRSENSYLRMLLKKAK